MEGKVLPITRTNTILYCRNWAVTLKFYRDVLALPVHHETDWFVEFQVCPGSYVSIADAARATVGATDGRGVTLSWQVADLHRSRDDLFAKGVAVDPIQRRWGSLYFCFRDPEGTRIELWSAAEDK